MCVRACVRACVCVCVCVCARARARVLSVDEAEPGARLRTPKCKIIADV